MTTWFTSDQHYGHHNVISYCQRPFVCVQEMTTELVERHNRVVAAGDVVWHLGDFSLDERYVLSVLPRLNGTHRLVMGNHDRCFKRDSFKRKYCQWGFASVHSEVHLDGWVLNHFPYAGDSHDKDRFTEKRPRDQGRWLLHGHVHGAWRQRGRMINVGVDVWGYQPVALGTLRALRA